MSTNNIISNLKTGAMLAGEVHYGNWGVMADVVSATLQKTSNTSVTPQVPYTHKIATKATLQQTILTGAATYNFINNQNATMDGLLGVRWIGVTASLNLAVDGISAAINGDSKTMSTADPIVGLKGRYRVANSTWYIPYYADIGSGGGLVGQVTLLNNGDNPLTITANGSIVFTTPVAYNSSYAVTVGTQPTGQICTVSNDSGSGVVANITNVTVTCRNNQYAYVTNSAGNTV